MKFKHNLGKKATDKVTGFTGIIIGRSEFLSGCNTYGLAPRVGKDGNRIDTEWFDEDRIGIVGSGISKLEITGDENGADNCQKPACNQ